ncbi:MAG: Rrf2 family transcriptional regulator [Phycisphaeraceae bacterium]|nr:Rrf2 family transcriptional regulator [Phycisphaerales bacterium]MCB9858836.1 Rrf2 family transcriptional regulator [Phycisphaeraceae bacterium]
MISQTSEYALRAVVYLAAQTLNEQTSASQISEATKVPVLYLQKVLRMLSKHHILTAQRGAGGGFQLAKLPSSISVYDVLRATETEIERISSCPLGIKGHTTLCALHKLLDSEIARIQQAFASTSIEDLLTTTNNQPLCRSSMRPQGLTISDFPAENKKE